MKRTAVFCCAKIIHMTNVANMYGSVKSCVCVSAAVGVRESEGRDGRVDVTDGGVPGAASYDCLRGRSRQSGGAT